MIIVALIRDFGYSDSTLPESKDKNRIIRKATEYIDMHFQENLTLETLARLSDLRRITFHRFSVR